MCKLFCLTNLTKLDQKDFNKNTIKEISKILCENQPDGLGFTLKHKKGMYTHKGCDSDSSIAGIGRGGNSAKNKMPFSSTQVRNDGFIPQHGLQSILIHARTSTNTVNYNSTHPFLLDNGNFAFAHNGVIQPPINHTYPVLTKNDSEYLAYDYLAKGAKDSLSNISGYAATISFNLNKKRIEIFRDSSAQLYMTYSLTLDTYLFTTCANDAMDIADLLMRNYEEIDFCIPELINDDTYLEVSFASAKILNTEIIENSRAAFSYLDQENTIDNLNASAYYRSIGKNKSNSKSPYNRREDHYWGDEGIYGEDYLDEVPYSAFIAKEIEKEKKQNS